MYYCKKCESLQKEEYCTKCKKHIDAVNPNDIVLLGSADHIKASMLEPILNSNKIPYIRKSTKGSAITTYSGNLGERIKYYVSFKNYDSAMDLVFPFFDENLYKP